VLKEWKYVFWSSSKWETKWLHNGYRHCPKRYGIWAPSILNSLLNSISSNSQLNSQEIVTEIKQCRISLLKDYTWRSIKTLWLNGILNWIPNCLTRGLQNDFEGEVSHQDPTKCRLKGWVNLHIHYPMRLSESQSALLPWWVWPPTVKLIYLICINDIPPMHMRLAHSTTLQWWPGSHICDPTAMMIQGAKAHIITQSQFEMSLHCRQDWAHSDASCDGKSTVWTCCDTAYLLQWSHDWPHWDVSDDSMSTGKTNQGSHWQWAMPKDDWSWGKIVCRLSQSQT